MHCELLVWGLAFLSSCISYVYVSTQFAHETCMCTVGCKCFHSCVHVRFRVKYKCAKSCVHVCFIVLYMCVNSCVHVC